MNTKEQHQFLSVDASLVLYLKEQSSVPVETSWEMTSYTVLQTNINLYSNRIYDDV